LAQESENRRNTLDDAEARRFAETAELWWDEEGPYRPLHKLNPARLSYIRNVLVRRFGRDAGNLRPLAGLKVLDIGCGGGLVAEPLARMGARVTGLDVSDDVLDIASAHARDSGLAIDYRTGTVEELAGTAAAFDAVLALEVVEHVADVPAFLAACRQMTKAQGAVVFSTLNRTARSFALGIVAAEYVLRWVPRGTHDWRRFLKPEELSAELRAAGLRPREIVGLNYDPLGDRWRISRDSSVNYIGWAAPED